MKQHVTLFASRMNYFVLIALATLGIVFAGLAFAPGAAAVDCDTTNPRDIGVNTGVNCAQGSDQPSNLFGDGGLFTIIVNVLLFLIGAVSVIMLIIGGIRYTISNGDQGAITSAKNTILYAVIGLIVAILAYAIVGFITGQFAQPN